MPMRERPTASVGHQSVPLRSSCNACTDVKMACSKDKPTCARCARRSEPCIYAPVKRAGRPGRKKSQQRPLPPQPPDITRFEEEPMDALASSQSMINMSPIAAGHFDTSAFNHSMLFDPFLSDQLAILDEASDSLVDVMDAIPSDSPTTAAAPAPFYSENANVGGSAGSGDKYGFSPHGSQYDSAMCASNEFDLLALFNSSASCDPYPIESSEHSALRSTGSPTCQGLSHTPSYALHPASCMARAMSLLHTLTPGTNLCANIVKDHNRHDDGYRDGTISPCDEAAAFQDIIARNEECVVAASAILRCPCSEEGALLNVLFLVISQILAWYAASAGLQNIGACFPLGQADKLPLVRPPTNSHFPGYDLKDEAYKDRVLCQIVLSKIHTVRRLVNSLAQRLSSVATPTDPPASEQPDSASSTIRGHSHNRRSDIFKPPAASNGLATILEDDLRRGLREISRAAVTSLAEW